MVSQERSQEERLRETKKFIILTGPRDRKPQHSVTQGQSRKTTGWSGDRGTSEVRAQPLLGFLWETQGRAE